MTVRILLVDDEANVLSALSRVLRRELGSDVLIETNVSAERALARARDTEFDVVMSDYRMPSMDGLEFLLAFRELQPDTSRIILSGMTDFDVLMTAINEVGILRFLLKPWDETELAGVVRDALVATGRKRDERRLADKSRAPHDAAYPEGVMRQVSQDEPGLLHVKWGPNGEVMLDEDESDAA